MIEIECAEMGDGAGILAAATAVTLRFCYYHVCFVFEGAACAVIIVPDIWMHRSLHSGNNRFHGPGIRRVGVISRSGVKTST
ncbi:hypothetical protein MTP99_005147 [Tenebrio molitor]|nr:hypothetical protein MTP99_005147 [Tenebrio molitor]